MGGLKRETKAFLSIAISRDLQRVTRIQFQYKNDILVVVSGPGQNDLRSKKKKKQ